MIRITYRPETDIHFGQGFVGTVAAVPGIVNATVRVHFSLCPPRLRGATLPDSTRQWRDLYKLTTMRLDYPEIDAQISAE